jgi:ABC-type multidrug transport system fused ATPase/permease subunit
LSSLFAGYPLEKGNIIVNNIDLKDYGKDIRRELALIPQDLFVFEGTLRDNIDILGELRDHEI